MGLLIIYNLWGWNEDVDNNDGGYGDDEGNGGDGDDDYVYPSVIVVAGHVKGDHVAPGFVYWLQ